MRIVTGSARGMKLKTLGGEATRPTLQRVKEAEFSAVQFLIEGARVLDLFAGSGQLGIEALSRGASSAAFVDISRESCDITRENLDHTGLAARGRVFNKDAFAFLKTTADEFDIVFVDPPYGQGTPQRLLPLLQAVGSLRRAALY